MFYVSCCFWEIYKQNSEEEVQIIEAATREVLKKLFLRISQISQENTWPKFLF